MTNKERADRARRAFDAGEHDDNDELTQIQDLVTNLLHLADRVGPTLPEYQGCGYDFNDPGRESAGAYVARLAEDHYHAEVLEAEEHAAWRQVVLNAARL